MTVELDKFFRCPNCQSYSLSKSEPNIKEKSISLFIPAFVYECSNCSYRYVDRDIIAIKSRFRKVVFFVILPMILLSLIYFLNIFPEKTEKKSVFKKEEKKKSVLPDEKINIIDQKVFEKKNIVSGFDLTLADDPYLPTDATTFYLKGIPVASFFTGVHMDYHTHRDDVELINFEDLHRVTKFASLITKELMKPEQALTYQQVKVKTRKRSKGALSVSLGTIPAYAGSDEPGVAIQGVRPGGPAEKANLMANDMIIGLNGKEVNNIYDFMNILNELKPDVEIDIVVMREGEKKNLKITPEAK